MRGGDPVPGRDTLRPGPRAQSSLRRGRAYSRRRGRGSCGRRRLAAGAWDLHTPAARTAALPREHREHDPRGPGRVPPGRQPGREGDGRTRMNFTGALGLTDDQVCSGIISVTNWPRNRSADGSGPAGLMTNLLRPWATYASIIRRASGQLAATRLAGSASGRRSRTVAISAAGMPSVATARLIP